MNIKGSVPNFCISLLFFALILLFLVRSFGWANSTESSSLGSSAILQNYAAAAFGAQRKQVVKFKNEYPIKMSLSCVTRQCNLLERSFVARLPNSFVLAEGVSVENNLQIFIYDSVHDLPVDFVDAQRFGENVFADGTNECWLVVTASKDAILRVRLLISNKLELRKAQTCALVQLFRGMGLQILGGLNFEKYWELNGTDIIAASEYKMQSISNNMKNLLELHYCMLLSDTVDKEEVLKILSLSIQKCLH